MTEYLASAVIVALSNLLAEFLPRTRISFSLLSVCIDELLSTPKIIIFLPHSPFIEKFERVPNRIL